MDEEEKDGLKISSINTQGELDEFEQLNIEKALEWTIRTNFKPERILTEKFILDLHKKMFGEVWKWAGKFRRSDKNLGVEWTKISVELRKLIDDTNFWIQDDTNDPEETSMSITVSIHCFNGGTGSWLILLWIYLSFWHHPIWWNSNIVEIYSCFAADGRHPATY